MSAVVSSRIVKRWFFRGKGYGSRRAVYIKIAKAMLYAETMGIECDCQGAGCDDCSEDRYSIPEEKWKDAYRQRFPVDKCPKLADRIGYRETCQDSREFCRCQYDAWLNAKVKELSAKRFGEAA